MMCHGGREWHVRVPQFFRECSGYNKNIWTFGRPCERICTFWISPTNTRGGVIWELGNVRWIVVGLRRLACVHNRRPFFGALRVRAGVCFKHAKPSFWFRGSAFGCKVIKEAILKESSFMASSAHWCATRKIRTIQDVPTNVCHQTANPCCPGKRCACGVVNGLILTKRSWKFRF